MYINVYPCIFMYIHVYNVIIYYCHKSLGSPTIGSVVSNLIIEVEGGGMQIRGGGSRQPSIAPVFKGRWIYVTLFRTVSCSLSVNGSARAIGGGGSKFTQNRLGSHCDSRLKSFNPQRESRSMDSQWNRSARSTLCCH